MSAAVADRRRADPDSDTTTTTTTAAAAPVQRPRSGAAGRRGLTRSAGLGLGISVLWLSLLVLIPLASVVGSALAGGPAKFWSALTNAQTLNAIGLTVSVAVGVAVVNAIIGTVVAWVLVRDRFVGRAVLDVIIDIPFALPTIVAGLVLLSLYGPRSPVGINIANTQAAVALAVLFVTLPFVVRSVMPVLESLEHDVEEAASSLGASNWTVFWKLIFPSLIPAIASGAALSFARGISEYGSLVLLSGNMPNRTEVVSVRVLSYIENGDLASAAAIATGMLVIALAVLILIDLLQRKAVRRDS